MNASTDCTAGDDFGCLSDWAGFLKLVGIVAVCIVVVVAVNQLYKFVRGRFFPPPGDDINNNHNNNSVVVEVDPGAASGGLRNTVTVFKKSGEGEGEEEVDEEQGRRRRRVQDECSICLEEFKNGDECSSLDVCGHLFHNHCFEPWLAQNRDCPLCRASVH